MNKFVEVTIDKSGKSASVSTSGFKGKSCMTYDEVLDGVATEIETKKTSEYHAREDATDVNIVGRN